MLALIKTDELEEMGRIMVKQLKNREGDLSKHRRFLIGVDRAKMRFFDVDDNEQEDILESPVMDNTDFGIEDSDRGKKFGNNKFKGMFT
jgi:hypothetical protein